MNMTSFSLYHKSIFVVFFCSNVASRVVPYLLLLKYSNLIGWISLSLNYICTLCFVYYMLVEQNKAVHKLGVKGIPFQSIVLQLPLLTFLRMPFIDGFYTPSDLYKVQLKFLDWSFHYIFGLAITIFLVATNSISLAWKILLSIAIVTDCVTFGLLYWWWGLEILCDSDSDLEIEQSKRRTEN